MKTKFMLQYPDTEPTGGGNPAPTESLLSAAPAQTAPVQAPIIQGDAAKVDWNSETWKDYLDEDIKGDPSLKAVKDLKGLAKSYVHAQRMVGADKFLVPNQYASPEEWNSVYGKLGKPESVDGYKLTLPEKHGMGEDFLKGLKETAFSSGLNNKQTEQFANFYLGQLETAQNKIAEIEKQEMTQEIDGLKKEWGQAFDSKIKAASTALKAFGGEEIFTYLQETGLDNNVHLAKFFAKVGEALAEDDTQPGNPSSGLQTPAGAAKELDSIMSNPAYFDRDHPEHQKIIEQALNLRRMTLA